MAAVAENLLAVAKYTGKLAADCASYLGRTSLDLIDGGRKLWLRRQRGQFPERAADIDSKLESIRAGQQARWNNFRAQPSARKGLIQVASWSAVLLAGYVFVLPSGPSGLPGSAGSGSGGKKVYYVWEGEISAKRVHVSADGVGNWTANYHVRLRENYCSSVLCILEPLELKYEVEANEVLDKNYFGVYPPGCYAPPNQPSGCPHTPPVPHNRSVVGKASGLLRLGENAPDEFKFTSNLSGVIYKGKQAPVAPTGLPRGESEAERYWNSCLAGVPEVTGRPAYRIAVSLTSGYGSQDLRSSSDSVPEVLNPLLKGIERSGPDLQEGRGNLHSRSDYARPVLHFWLCGRLKSPDDVEMSGEHAFSSTSNNIDELYSGPTQVNIIWNLKRKRVELQEPGAKPEKPEKPEKPGQAGLAPADLVLKAESAPGKATPGEKISYKFEIKNKGPADAQGVMFTIALGNAELIKADASQGECTGTGASVTCKLGVLKKDDTANVTLRLMPRVAGMLSSTAHVYSVSPDPDMSNNVENVAVRIQPQN